MLLEFYDRYLQKPSRDVLLQGLYDRSNRLGWDVKDRDRMVEHLHTIYTYPLQDADTKHVKDQIAQFGRIQALKGAMLESIAVVDDFDRGDERAKLESVEQKIRSALSVGSTKNLGISLSHVMQDMKSLCGTHDLAAIDRRVPTGYPSMDRCLKGGLGGGELGFVIAPSNRGKSMVLVNLAAASFRAGKKTIYFTFEMKEPEVASRMAACLTNCTIDQVQSGDLTYHQKIGEIKYILDQRNYRIIYVKPSDATPSNLRAILMKIETMEGWKPQAIFVDYLDEMPVAPSKNDDDNYNGYGKLASELLSIGVDYQCPVWSASQVNRSGYEGDPTLQSIGRSMQKVDKAEFVITIILDRDKMILKILKNRRGPGVGMRIKCVPELEKAIIREEASQK
jgi:replicative DNA helicase